MSKGRFGRGAVISVAGALALFVVACEPSNPPGTTTTTTEGSTTPDISGAWDLTLVRTTGSSQQIVFPGSTMTLSQSGKDISGNTSFGDIEGTVDSDRNVKLNIDRANSSFDYTLSGTVASNGTKMTGTWTYQGGGSGTWEAEKK